MDPRFKALKSVEMVLDRSKPLPREPVNRLHKIFNTIASERKNAEKLREAFGRVFSQPSRTRDPPQNLQNFRLEIEHRARMLSAVLPGEDELRERFEEFRPGITREANRHYAELVLIDKFLDAHRSRIELAHRIYTKR